MQKVSLNTKDFYSINKYADLSTLLQILPFPYAGDLRYAYLGTMESRQLDLIYIL